MLMENGIGCPMGVAYECQGANQNSHSEMSCESPVR